MTNEGDLVDTLETRAIRREGRRAFFKAALGTAAIAAGGLAMANAAQAAGPVLVEEDYLNFALNLEYLEANYYSFAVTGNPINASLTTGVGTAGAATGGALVTFTDPVIQQLANELLEDEIAHITYLRGLLTAAAVAQPRIDLSAAGAFAVAATKAQQPAPFDPYANDGSFLLGAFLFEDVGVTAYGGAMSAAAVLTSPKYLDGISGLLSVEAQHAAAIRGHLHNRGVPVGKYIAPDPSQVTNAGLLSGARDALDGPSVNDDQGINTFTTDVVDPRDTTGATFLVESNIALVHDADNDPDNGMTFKRTPSQVLNIVYLDDSSSAKTGGFFPAGMNGKINTVTA